MEPQYCGCSKKRDLSLWQKEGGLLCADQGSENEENHKIDEGEMLEETLLV